MLGIDHLNAIHQNKKIGLLNLKTLKTVYNNTILGNTLIL